MVRDSRGVYAARRIEYHSGSAVAAAEEAREEVMAAWPTTRVLGSGSVWTGRTARDIIFGVPERSHGSDRAEGRHDAVGAGAGAKPRGIDSQRTGCYGGEVEYATD